MEGNSSHLLHLYQQKANKSAKQEMFLYNIPCYALKKQYKPIKVQK